MNDPNEMYKLGRMTARSFFRPDCGLRDFSIWEEYVRIIGLGPSADWRTGYIDEARNIWRDSRGIVEDN
jgi:hypothetical protein